MAELLTEIAGIEFKNPVWLASGTCGYGEELTDFYGLDELGAIVTKTISLEPRAGHPPPRVFETSSGMLNAIGLQNVGVDKFISEKVPFLRKHRAKLVVNVAGRSVDEYCRVSETLNSVSDDVVMIELNMSCPNVASGMEFSKKPSLASELVKSVKKITPIPVIAKLSPNVSDITEIAVAVEEGGADALSMINTLVGMAVDVNTFKPRLSNITGGLSGPAIKPVALAMVYRASQAVKLPIIGIGGIRNVEDVIEFMLCGASAVQVGTANFIDPMTPMNISHDLDIWLERKGFTSPSELIGKIEVE
ncbi:MAG: dihydroorotate dehydrogenase [candidate division Zixibacteria bacterium]|nr:dihydroorotate dehydrogenase [candidate division Zixibacteria bacterium]